MWNNGVWKKGKKTITSKWRWSRSAQRFYVVLDKSDPLTGQTRTLELSGDEPNFNGFKLQKTL